MGYDMHRLVHLATRIWVNEQGNAAEVMVAAVQHMAEIFPSDDYTNRAVRRAYLPHALRLLGSGHECDVEEQSDLSLLVGRCLQVDGRIQEAVTWLEESCRQRHLLDEDHPSRLASQHVLAGAYRADGQVTRAVKLLEHVVAVREKVLAEDHPYQLVSQHVLAMAYSADGQVTRAVKLLEHVVAIKSRVLRIDHPSRLVSVEALSDLYAELAVVLDEVSSSSSL